MKLKKYLINKNKSKLKVKKFKVTNVKYNKIKKQRKPRKLTSPTSPLMYFTDDTEQAIILYNNTEDKLEKDLIYNTRIHYPFSKLVENIFNTFKFSYFETGAFDAQKECLSHLVANIHKYDPKRRSKINPHKKTKAYAYFSIVAKHFLILLNNNNYKIWNRSKEIGEDHEEHTVQLQHTDKHHNQQEMKEFMKLMVDYFENNVGKIFNKEKDLNIANAVIEIIRNSDRIDIFNKKMLYVYIREMSDCKTQQITKILTKMKGHYACISNQYKNTGIIDE